MVPAVRVVPVMPDGALPGAGGDGVPAEHAELARRLRGAEDRLFPVAMVDADRYRWSLTLVGALARRLAAAGGGWPELGSASADLHEALPALAAELGVPLTALDADLIVDAARAQRLRGLLAQQQLQRRERLVAAAIEAGQAWAVLDEPDPALAGFGELCWVELHVGSGALLIRRCLPDPQTGQPEYRVESPSGREEFTDRQAWLAAVERARQAVESES